MPNDQGNTATRQSAVEVRSLETADLPEAQRIVRLAFGTLFGAPSPETFWTDRDYVFSRHPARHIASFAATLDGRLVGSNFVTRWGSVGFFGPITVHPHFQDRGIARELLARTMRQFDDWGTRHVGLFTFAQSAKHVALYHKYGFHARFLTAVMSAKATRTGAEGWSRFSALSETERASALRACREIAETVYPGLDLTGEIETTLALGLGDVVLLDGATDLAAFAICHYGPRSEAGAERCFVKFAAVRNTASAEQDYVRLLDACEALAVAVGMPVLLIGTNLARHESYRHLVARGFRAEIQGVAMHRHNDEGYCRPGLFILDDWR